MNEIDMQFVDDVYYQYLKNLLVAGKSQQPIPEHEQAMLDNLLTLDECFMIELLCHA
jgi:hypothetical protein